ncbi:MAG TPA: hypothetical protein VEA44_01855 [Caulobacter sp.]|nr:hypothetical protein [Caulobacter sp.]
MIAPLAAVLLLFQPLAAGPPTTITEIDPAALPAELRALIEKHVPGMTITEVQRKEREGRVYFDVEGERPGGAEVELDIQQTAAGYELVEIQRDIAFEQIAPGAQGTARQALAGKTPARIIESLQTDGAVIYEFFAEGMPAEPAIEVRWANGEATVLSERWPH